MKRYERMSKEEIISLFRGMDWCEQCPLFKGHDCLGSKNSCNVDVAEHLNEEIKTKKVHRYELIKSPEDVDKILKERDDVCNAFDGSCEECKYNKHYYGTSAHCFANYLKEEIEVEE